MKARPVNKLVKVMIAVTGLVVASTAFAAQATPSKTTIQDVEKKVAEAVESVKAYAVDQRAEAVQKAKAALDDIDVRIDQMDSRIREKWGQMDQTARQQAAADLTALRNERNQVAEWYGGLKHSSSQAWGDVKTGFLKSVQDLGDAFSKAYREF